MKNSLKSQWPLSVSMCEREVTCLCSLPDKAQNQGLKEGSRGSRSSKLLERCREQQEDLLSGGTNEILIF